MPPSAFALHYSQIKRLSSFGPASQFASCRKRLFRAISGGSTPCREAGNCTLSPFVTRKSNRSLVATCCRSTEVASIPREDSCGRIRQGQGPIRGGEVRRQCHHRQRGCGPDALREPCSNFGSSIKPLTESSPNGARGQIRACGRVPSGG